MYKRYKRLVYSPPDLLARFCKVNLSNAKNSNFEISKRIFYCLPLRKIMIINLRLCWSVPLLKFIQTLDLDWLLALDMRTGCRGDFGNFLNGFAKSARLIVLNIDWVQFVLKNCEIPYILSQVCMINRYCFTSDVMYKIKKYKRLVYTPSDLLARICKVNLSKAKKFGLICFPRICFRGLIYCDQGPLWLLNVIFGCTYLGYQLDVRCFTPK